MMGLVQLGICMLVAYSVLAFGAVDPFSEFILEIGAVGLLLVWFLQAVRRRRVDRQRASPELRGAPMLHQD